MGNTSFLFKGTVANAATQYVNLPIKCGTIGAQVAWLDATSAGTLTVEFSNYTGEDAPTTTAGTYQWKDSGVVITGPAASAASSVLINIDNVRQKRARLKFVATASSSLEVLDGAVTP